CGVLVAPGLFSPCPSSRLTIRRSASGRIRVAMTGTSLPGKLGPAPGRIDKVGLWIGGATRGHPPRRSRAAHIRSPRLDVKGGSAGFFPGGLAGSADGGDEAVLDPAGEERAGLGRRPRGPEIRQCFSPPPQSPPPPPPR